MGAPQGYAPPASGPSGSAPDQSNAALSVQLEPGGFWLRFGARVIDLIAVTMISAGGGAVGGVVVSVLGSAGVITAGWQTRLHEKSAIAMVISLLASIVYHSFTETFGGATIGKAICGLRVLTEDRRPCTFGKALGRNLAYYIDAFFFGAVAWGSMSKSPMKQRLGDSWAGTIVVHRATELPQQNVAVGIALGVAATVALQAAGVVMKAI